MKQELISNFLIKNSGKFTIEQYLEIQKLLQTTKDDAFPILMTYKTPSRSWEIFLVVFPMLYFIPFLMANIGLLTERLHINWCWYCFSILSDVGLNPSYLPIRIISFLLFLATIILSIMWYKSGKLGTRKRRMYEEYLKIINAYQVS